MKIDKIRNLLKLTHREAKSKDGLDTTIALVVKSYNEPKHYIEFWVSGHNLLVGDEDAMQFRDWLCELYGKPEEKK